MTPEQKMVREFHEVMGLDDQICEQPVLRPNRIGMQRYLLMREELEEYQQAGLGMDLVGVADALGDLLYVVYGTAVAYGIDLEPVFQEIHASNMTKRNGHRSEETGKWIKPDDYRPAELEPIIARQQEERT